MKSRWFLVYILGPANSTAHMIFLTIQSVLLMPGNMTGMPVCHSSFFPSDLVITVMHMRSLSSADITISQFMVDAPVLMVQPPVYFSTPGMIFRKAAILSHGDIRETNKC